MLNNLIYGISEINSHLFKNNVYMHNCFLDSAVISNINILSDITKVTKHFFLNL